MKKKILMATTVTSLFLAFSTTVFANGEVSERDYLNNSGIEFNDANYGFMLDENGEFLSEEEFAKKLDGAIENGYITDSDRDAYSSMYEYCSSNGGFNSRRGLGGLGFGGLCH